MKQRMSMTMALAALLAILAARTAQADVFHMGTGMTSLQMVPVGNPGNAGELSGQGAGGFGPDRVCGHVDYVYRIGKYEVTNAQYTEFLNAVDPEGSNSLALYSYFMGTALYHGGITFNSGNASGSKYEVRTGRGDKPVNWVSFWDACRFANWLNNGQGSGDTDTGAYTLTAEGIANNTVTRNAGWRFAVASEDEWYKAAFYDPVAVTYYDYATASNTTPTAEIPPGANDTNGSANYDGVVGDLTDVGAYTYKPSDSAYGTYDQSGNVCEWNDEIMGTYRGIRGSSFWTFNLLEMPADRRWGGNPANEDFLLGYRVVSIPEPSTALPAIVGLLFGLYWWRRVAA